MLSTLVSSSRALVTGAKDVTRFREITQAFLKHGFGWFFAQMQLRRELQVDHEGADLTRAALSSPDTGKRFVKVLAELGPTFVKFGQILSTRPDLLPESIIRELATLQDAVDPLPFEALEPQLIKALGADYRDLFSELDTEPIGSASIAQVHRATLKDGREVVLKIQRPGVVGKIERDLSILFALAGYAEEAIPEARAMDLRGVVAGFTKSITQELDFGLEARNLARFQRNFADHPNVVFPAVEQALSSTEVLGMEFMAGRKFSEVIANNDYTEEVAQTYFDLAYKMLFKDGFFHGDLHPGNVIVLPDNRLAILDCGMVGRLSPALLDKVIDSIHAILTEDLEGLAQTVYALATPYGVVDYRAYETDVVEVAERYLVGMPLSEIRIGTLLSEIVRGCTRHNLRMPTAFTMLFKATLTTEGLAKSIAPDLDPIELARPYIMDTIAQRYSVDRLQHQALADVNTLSRMLRALPQTVPMLIRNLQDGNLTLGLSEATLETYRSADAAQAGRRIRTLISITCLACGTYTIGLPLPVWGVLGIPYLSAAFYVGAGIGLLSVLVKR